MATIGRLAGALVHDFNNLLAVISSYGHSISMDPAASAAHARAAQIQEAASRAQELARRMLALGQPCAGSSAELDAAVSDMRAILTRLAGDIEVRFALGAPGVRVCADAVDLQRVLLNLVVNARDAMPRGGVVTVTTAVAGAEATLAVADTGDGIDEAVLARVFDAHVSTKDNGTGLGLSIVDRIARGAGGSVTARSVRGEGTTFTLVLPRA